MIAVAISSRHLRPDSRRSSRRRPSITSARAGTRRRLIVNEEEMEMFATVIVNVIFVPLIFLMLAVALGLAGAAGDHVTGD